MHLKARSHAFLPNIFSFAPRNFDVHLRKQALQDSVLSVCSGAHATGGTAAALCSHIGMLVLRCPSENYPVTRHGASLWEGVTVPNTHTSKACKVHAWCPQELGYVVIMCSSY